MMLFPNAKINLGLHITAKRTDGFHELETIFYPIPLKDMLEVITSPNKNQPLQNQVENITFSTSGLEIPGDPTKNLCIRAYQLIKNDFEELPPVKMHLHKNIPMGAGMGGGSADGAFALNLLNQKFQLNLTTTQLLQYAAQLGSDCPFFIVNKPCFAHGRGELMEPIALDLSNYQFVLVHPNIHVSTKWAFEQLTPSKPPVDLRGIIQQPIETWKDSLYNDFEAPIARLHPEIQVIKNVLYQNGAIYASMTGSGSTVFGIFPQQLRLQLKDQIKDSFNII